MLELLERFFVENGYVLEVIVCTGLFCFFFKRRRFFWLRLIAVFALMLGLSMLWQSGYAACTTTRWSFALYNIMKYIAFFLMIFGGILCLFRINRWGALFCAIGSMATQHLEYKVYACILALAGMDYGSVASFFIALGVLIAVCAAVYLILVRRVRNYSEQCFENKINIFLGGLFILFSIVIYFFIEPYIPMHEQPTLFILVSMYSLICSICTLLLEYGFAHSKMVLRDNAILMHLVHKQEEEYRISKSNIEMINIKCHDMKHQLSKLVAREGSTAAKEIEDIIHIYDSSIRTGNEILDVFLAEKKLICESNRIKFECVACGECLSFLEPSEVYSLFGNAIDNAIEALCRIDNLDRRILELSVKSRLGMAIIHVGNFFEGEVDFESGLPRTTKEGNGYHGFGMRSIQMIVEKYGGNMSILPENNFFNLNIIIPIPVDGKIED